MGRKQFSTFLASLAATVTISGCSSPKIPYDEQVDYYTNKYQIGTDNIVEVDTYTLNDWMNPSFRIKNAYLGTITGMMKQNGDYIFSVVTSDNRERNIEVTPDTFTSPSKSLTVDF